MEGRSREERAEMAIGFFKNLLQGHHRSNGEIEETSFQPDDEMMEDFLGNLPAPTQQEMETLSCEISEEEVKLVIENSSNNKSPGLDGISYEFYKKNKE